MQGFPDAFFYLLGDTSINYVKLSRHVKGFLLGFCNNDYIIEDSKGFIVGDKVFVTSGSLQGNESIIKKINRHKRRAEIELMWLGDIRRVSKDNINDPIYVDWTHYSFQTVPHRQGLIDVSMFRIK